jgi:hypothetical protein
MWDAPGVRELARRLPPVRLESDGRKIMAAQWVPQQDLGRGDGERVPRRICSPNTTFCFSASAPLMRAGEAADRTAWAPAGSGLLNETRTLALHLQSAPPFHSSLCLSPQQPLSEPTADG